MVQTEENVPPEILSHTDGTVNCGNLQDVPVDALCFAFDEQQVHVTATDADDDVLEFFWEGTVSGPIGDAVPIEGDDIQGSQVFLFKSEVVDGEELRCTVSDGSEDRKIQAWTIVVL